MSLGKNTNWLELDPDVLERIIPETEGFIAIDDLEAASQTAAPGLKEAFLDWGRGITVSEAGIPLRDWKAFLRALQGERGGEPDYMGSNFNALAPTFYQLPSSRTRKGR